METQALTGIVAPTGAGWWWLAPIILGITALAWFPHWFYSRPTLKIEIVQGDITTEKVDVIVNAAKSSLLGGGGVDGAIHRAGGPAILEECKELRRNLPHGLYPGWAVITTAGALPAQWVVHTVGPVYDPRQDQSYVLRSCYTKSLEAADVVGARTVAFPLISAGVYGWPKDDAVKQALTAIRSANTQVKTVRLVVFDEDTYRIALAQAEVTR